MKIFLALLLLIPSLSWGYKGFSHANCEKMELGIAIWGGAYKTLRMRQKEDDFEKNQKLIESLNKTSSELADQIIIYNYFCKEE